MTLFSAAGLAAEDAVNRVDFRRDIQPIFVRSCQSCHGPMTQHAGLRLDTPQGLREGSHTGPVLRPGEADQSRLVHAIKGRNGFKAMPLRGEPLDPKEIHRIETWINQGARLPEGSDQNPKPESQHWAFQPLRRPPIPHYSQPIDNPIDVFIAVRLEHEGLQLSPRAERATLLRRLALDLTGLPPSPEAIDAFVQDPRPDAYERQVDRLLSSPRYGERWGRHWLDLARYADSNGYSVDSPRTMWPYRDWVIDSLNADLPFDRFSIEQLAGDLLAKPTQAQRIATGFHRNTQINQEGGIDKEQFRIESIVDRVNTTGSVWLGLTVGCCQCHNHKFDPISQREYYQLFAFFNTQDEPRLAVNVDSAWAESTKKDQVKTLVLREQKAPRSTRILIGGDFTRPGRVVTPDTPSILPALNKLEGSGSPDRLDLAHWLLRPDHPLTARVTINRIWSRYFGRGIVETENDFGTQGTPPSHPELLEWLACEWIEQGWSLKRLHRLIVTSATYRQQSALSPALAERDPRNRLLGRQARLRVEAEIVRDLGLAVSGLLDHRIGGPSAFPPQPKGVSGFTQVKRAWKSSTGPDRYRRGMYTHFWRASPHPALTVFDAPDAGTTCTRRNRSNTPLQALTLLNDAGFAEYAYGLALRLLQEVPEDPQVRVELGFRLCLGRHPTEAERQRLCEFVMSQLVHYQSHPEEATTLLNGGGPPGARLDAFAEVSPAEKAATVLLARVLLNLDEFLTRE